MSDSSGIFGRMTIFPAGTKAFLSRRATEVAGGCLILAALAFLLALATFDSADPSLNKAVDGPVRNLLGLPGAYTADLALQSVGLASLVLPIGLLAWGWRLLRHYRIGRGWLRLALLPAAILAAAIALTPVPATDNWPAATGFGGSAGALLLYGPQGDAGLLGLLGTGTTPIGLAGAVVALALLFFTLGIPWLDYLAFGRGTAGVVEGAGRSVARVYGMLRRSGDRAGAALRRQQRLSGKSGGRDRLEPQLDEPGQAAPIDIPTPPLTASGGRQASAPRVEVKKPKAKASRRAASNQATLDLLPGDDYALPPLELLEQPTTRGAQRVNEESLEKNARLLESVLEDFGVKGQIVKVRPGPVVTLYELEPAPGTKTSRVVGLADDVARSMSAVSVRVAVVPGRSVIGIELPNRRRETVYLRELLADEAYERTAAKLALVLGKDIGGAPIIVDLARMPHLLIAGTTGSGKSVAINTMILSLIYRLPPDKCKFIMIDPKMLELSVYDGIPHLLTPVVTEPRKAIVALKWVVREMEERYRAMSKLGVRNVEGYNARAAQAREAGEILTRRVQTGFDPETGSPIYEEEPFDLEPLPFIVVVVDEMADLMLVAGKDIEAAIQRLAQMARAAGIHIIMATQRPSVDVITGTIKANFPTRVSFHVTSKIDSRTILGETGAEQLLGQGDMLYMANGGRITRIHGPFVGDNEVESVVQFLKRQGEPTYIEEVTRDDEEKGGDLGLDGGGSGDALYDQAVALVCRERKASTSFVQRHLQIGYNRAARLIERMEKEGVVSGANHVGKREVLGRNIDDIE
ncbi:DNA translocase FtsK 4TM domain-containing protein [Rhodospirillaceae bacterium SYSU D60014]|uniref:FtsK/SpoIIIE family DNA translocase n=1 Tax=Virgifigura deserti TaxID=2268457 RepID=UPI000E660118